MAATYEHRQRARAAGTVALLAATGILTAGCEPDVGQPAPTDRPPSPAATTGPPQLDFTGDQQELPDTAQAYAELTVAAWAAPDLSRLAGLATPEVHATLVELPGPPDPPWTFIRCETDAGASDCSFYNADGDQLVLSIDRQLLSAPHAAVDVTFDTTRYPQDFDGYLAEFISAWQAGNRARIDDLGTPGTAAGLPHPPPEPPVAQQPDPPPDATTPPAVVSVTITTGADELVARVNTGLLGEPHAIRTVEPTPR